MMTPKGWTRHATGTFSIAIPASETPEPIIPKLPEPKKETQDRRKPQTRRPDPLSSSSRA
jgi:hypothetical protein